MQTVREIAKNLNVDAIVVMAQLSEFGEFVPSIDAELGSSLARKLKDALTVIGPGLKSPTYTLGNPVSSGGKLEGSGDGTELVLVEELVAGESEEELSEDSAESEAESESESKQDEYNLSEDSSESEADAQSQNSDMTKPPVLYLDATNATLQDFATEANVDVSYLIVLLITSFKYPVKDINADTLASYDDYEAFMKLAVLLGYEIQNPPDQTVGWTVEENLTCIGYISPSGVIKLTEDMILRVGDALFFLEGPESNYARVKTIIDYDGYNVSVVNSDFEFSIIGWKKFPLKFTNACPIYRVSNDRLARQFSML